MDTDYETRRHIMCELMNYEYLYSQLFERKSYAIGVEYVGCINGIPFQCEPQSKIIYYLFKLDGIYIDVGLNKEHCSVSLSSSNECSVFNYLSTDDHTHVPFELLWRLTHLVSMINKYIVMCSHIMPVSDSFDLRDIVSMDRRMHKFMTKYY